MHDRQPLSGLRLRRQRGRRLLHPADRRPAGGRLIRPDVLPRTGAPHLRRPPSDPTGAGTGVHRLRLSPDRPRLRADPSVHGPLPAQDRAASARADRPEGHRGAAGGDRARLCEVRGRRRVHVLFYPPRTDVAQSAGARRRLGGDRAGRVGRLRLPLPDRGRAAADVRAPAHHDAGTPAWLVVGTRGPRKTRSGGLRTS